jgi:hypothetical protein
MGEIKSLKEGLRQAEEDLDLARKDLGNYSACRAR